MLDSIREIFDILGLKIESIRFMYEAYHDKSAKLLAEDISEYNICPVVVVRDSFFDSTASEISSHAMVATGIEDGYDEDEGRIFIQLKNSHRDDPDKPGLIIKTIIPRSTFEQNLNDLQRCAFFRPR